MQVEGEKTRDASLQVEPSSILQYLHALIADQLDDFDFEYKFLKQGMLYILYINR